MSQLPNKIQIPIKTKIAFGILFCVCLLAITYSLYSIISLNRIAECSSSVCWPFGIVVLDYFHSILDLTNNTLVTTLIDLANGILVTTIILLLLGSAGLIFGKKVGWWFVVSLITLIEVLYTAILLMESGFSMALFYIPSVLVFISILLLILDRNNYFAAIDNFKK